MNETEIMQINPLSEKEFRELEKYLERYTPVDESDFPILSISALDGYLTALISAPVHYPMGFWLKPLFDFGKAKMKTVEKVINLLLRHYNNLVYSLNVDPENSPFEPIFDWFGENDEGVFVTDFWCMGYLKFIELSDILVTGGDKHLKKIMEGTVFLFSYNENNKKRDELILPPASLAEKMADDVIEAVCELHHLGRTAYLQALQEELEMEEKATRH